MHGLNLYPLVISRLRKGKNNMEIRKFIYYKEDDMYVGWLEEYPDYRTQGDTLEELKENLLDIYNELEAGNISCVHKVGELKVA